MTSRGRSSFFSLFLFVALSATQAQASSLTIRDIQVKSNQIEIQLDGVAPKAALDLDYVRDIVQFSIQNATLYPAKILHVEHQTFSKVFAYQYAPSLVRVRLSVEGKAEDFRNQVKFVQKGKSIVISFPDSVVHSADNSHEKSLLARVLGTSKSEKTAEASPEKSDKKSDKNAEKISEKKSEKALEAKAVATSDSEDDKKTVKVEAISEEKVTKLNREAANAPHLTGKPSGTPLGTKSNGQSPMRSFFAMFLVVGSLGLVLIYVKKRQKGGQAKRVGDSWFSNMLPQGMRKQKSLIEVVGTHPIGPKQSIVVIRIRGQQFVLGVTQDNVQLISQLDADENELDLLDDPNVAASIGKMFGGKPQVQAVNSGKANDTFASSFGASFGALLKKSDGAMKDVFPTASEKPAPKSPAAAPMSATSAMGRNAYQSNGSQAGLTQIPEIRAQQEAIAMSAIHLSTQAGMQNTLVRQAAANSGIRDQIKKRMEGMKSI